MGQRLISCRSNNKPTEHSMDRGEEFITMKKITWSILHERINPNIGEGWGKLKSQNNNHEVLQLQTQILKIQTNHSLQTSITILSNWRKSKGKSKLPRKYCISELGYLLMRRCYSWGGEDHSVAQITDHWQIRRYVVHRTQE